MSEIPIKMKNNLKIKKKWINNKCDNKKSNWSNNNLKKSRVLQEESNETDPSDDETESEVVYSPGEMTAEDHKISEVQLPSFEKLEDSSESEQVLPHKKFATCPVIKIDTKKSHWFALLDTVAQLSAVSKKQSRSWNKEKEN